MKKLLFGGIFLSLMVISCSKDDDNNTPEEPVTEVYLNSAAGSTWQYENIDNTGGDPTQNYTLTSTNRDTTAEGNTYHVYTNSLDANEYNRKSGNDYYAFQPLPLDLGSSKVTNLYLKAGATVNATWNQSYPVTYATFNFTVNMSSKMLEKNITRTVNGTAYTNVLHIKNDVSFSGLPPGTVTLTTDIHQYYAPGYGLIERNARAIVDLLGTKDTLDLTTRLKSATLL